MPEWWGRHGSGVNAPPARWFTLETFDRWTTGSVAFDSVLVEPIYKNVRIQVEAVEVESAGMLPCTFRVFSDEKPHIERVPVES